MGAERWDIYFKFACVPIIMTLSVTQLLVLLFYVRRRAPLLLRTRPITPYLFLSFLFLRGVNTAIAEGYRLSNSVFEVGDTIETIIWFSEYFYVWALFFVASLALVIQVLQQVVVKHRLEANKQALFHLIQRSNAMDENDGEEEEGDRQSTATVAASSTRLRRVIRLQRLLSSRHLAVVGLVILLSIYFVATALCIAVYFTVISKMGSATITSYRLVMYLMLICAPIVLASIVGVLLLTVDFIVACIDTARMRRNAVPWHRIRQWLLNYIMDRPHYLRLETLAVMIFPVIGIAYMISRLLGFVGLHSGYASVIAWILNFILLLYPGGGILVILTIAMDLRQWRKQHTVAKDSILLQESESFKTYMSRVLTSVGDGSKNAQAFLGIMSQCKKEHSTENMYSARELLFMIKELKKLAHIAPMSAQSHTEEQQLTSLDHTLESIVTSSTNIPQLKDGEGSSGEDADTATAIFESTFETIRLRWQSFLDLYIRVDASLEINVTANLRASALALEFDPSQVEHIINVLENLFKNVLINLQDTYSRFERVFETGALML